MQRLFLELIMDKKNKLMDAELHHLAGLAA